MNIRDHLPLENIVLDLAAQSKPMLLKQLSTIAAERLSLDAKDIAAAIGNRERLGSTGIGAGIAIPHAGIKGLDRHFCLFARLARPVDFEAVDEEPVDLVFFLLNPEGRTEHLNILSCIARRVRQDAVAVAIRAAGDANGIYLQLSPANP